MGFDYEPEAFAGLPRQNITESVGMARNVSNGSQLGNIESDTGSLQGWTRIEGAQRHGKSGIVENAIDDRGVVGLQNFSVVDNSEG